MRKIATNQFEIDGRSVTFNLFERDVVRPGWRNLKLVAEGGGLRKRNWWIGWNTPGQRLAVNRDSMLLDQYLPDVAEWVIEQMEALG